MQNKYLELTGAVSGKRYLVHVDLIAEVYEAGCALYGPVERNEIPTDAVPTEHTHVITKRQVRYEVRESYEAIRDALAERL